MKKIIILSVFTLISMSTLRGQTKSEPSPLITASFNRQFKEATDVKWDKTGNLSFAKFHYQKDLTIAYFDGSGSLVAKGRKIREDQLPIRLHADLLAAKSECEEKSGALAVGNIFEYLNDSDDTQYVTSLENNNEYFVVGTVNGKMIVRSKSKKDANTPGITKDIIAKGLPK